MNMLDAAQIRAIRKQLGKTQTEFAYLVGVSTSAVITWEKGSRHPTWKRMARINELAQGAAAPTSNSHKKNGHRKELVGK